VDFFTRLAQPRRHEKIIHAHFGEKSVYTGTGPVFPYPLYILGFANRSGSNLLADYLRSIDHFSGFHEQLNHDIVVRTAAKLGATSFPEYFEKVSSNAGGKAYGFKASWDQILMLMRCQIHLMYPDIRVIHITRNDIIAQGVSYSVARQTKQWTSQQTGIGNVTPEFSFKSVAKMAEGALFSQNAIEFICALFRIARIEVTYEALTKKPEATIVRIGRFSDIDLSSWKAPPPAISKQAQDQSKKFVRRFKARVKHKLLSKKATLGGK
jgi:LPS sulfotransferase NodH